MSVDESAPAAAASASVLGFTAGLRSHMPMALLAWSAGDDDPALLRRRFVSSGLGLSAFGEVVADKLPMVPSRLNPGSLAGRLGFGALSGALLCRRRGTPVVVGAAAGAAGALAGSYAGYHTRVHLGRSTGVADAVWAGLEDVAAIAIGLLVTRR